MSKSEDDGAQDVAGPQAKSAMMQMIATMADTTWRMFLPTLGLLIVGVYFDKTRGLFPWCTLAGFALGVVISALLIRNQFKKGSR